MTVSLVRRASRRYMARHRWQIGLSLLGVALGVAVVIAIDLANESARRAFLLSQEAVAGKTTHQIVGGPAGVPEDLYRTLRVDLGIPDAAPVVEGRVRLAAGDRVLRLVGVDPFAERRFRSDLWPAGQPLPVARLVAEPATGLLSAQAARGLGIKPGDRTVLVTGGGKRTLTVIGLLRGGDSAMQQALSGFLLTDIATAQELLDRTGRLTRIDLIVPQGKAGDAELDRIRAVLPLGTQIIRAAAHTRALAQMTHAFQSNLAAMSLLALIVGVFLIYNTMTFSVVQRRGFIGLLRALGVTRGEIFTLILGEALFIGCVGTLAGTGLGIVLGHGLVHFVTRTINDLYFLVSVRQLVISPASLAKGTALGVAGTLVAALLPAIEASRAPPRAAMSRSAAEARMHRALPYLTAAGLGLLAAGAAVLLRVEHSLALSYGGVFVVIVGFALLIPLATVSLSAVLRPVFTRLGGALGGMAARGVSASLSRTGVAVAALTIAIATTIGVGVMIDSFRGTLANWLKTYLRADIYVTTAAGDDYPLDPALVKRLVTTPGVAAYSTGRHFRLDTGAGVTELLALGLPPRSRAAFQFKEGRPDRVWPAFEHGGLIVSESYAYHYRLHTGDRLRLRTADGMHAFAVVGVFYHYGSDQGVVFLSRGTYEKYWHDSSITSLGLYAVPGVDLSALSERLQNRAGTDRSLTLRTNRAVRDMSLRIFDRTFAITAVLRALTVIVAFIGILSALMALQLERAREFAVLRAVGLTPGGIWGLVTSQTGLMGLLAGLLAVPLGLILALILVFVINRLSFGWTLQLTVHPAVALQALAFSLLAALLAGLVPAFKMARTPPAAALREE